MLRAAMRLVDLALPLASPGQALRFALLPAGQDPDDLIRAGGPAAMQTVLDAAAPLVDLLWRRETEGRSFDSPERRAALEHSLKAASARIADPATRAHTEAELRARQQALFAPSRAHGRPDRTRRGKGMPPPPEGPRASTRGSLLVAADEGDKLLEATVLALSPVTPPCRFVRGAPRTGRPADPFRAALLHDLLQAAKRGLPQRPDDHFEGFSRPHGSRRRRPALLAILGSPSRLEARRAVRAKGVEPRSRSPLTTADEGLPGGCADLRSLTRLPGRTPDGIGPREAAAMSAALQPASMRLTLSADRLGARESRRAGL